MVSPTAGGRCACLVQQRRSVLLLPSIEMGGPQLCLTPLSPGPALAPAGGLPIGWLSTNRVFRMLKYLDLVGAVLRCAVLCMRAA